MQPLNPLTITAIILTALMLLFILIILFYIWAKNQLMSEKAYNEQYQTIKNYVRDWPVSAESYKVISVELDRLVNMKYKNKEKTNVLTDQFLLKYVDGVDGYFKSQLKPAEKEEKKVTIPNVSSSLLERAMLTLDDYLNAGSKETRKIAAENAKFIYKEYYGVDYINRNER